ncbi:MAG: carboxylesterase family protein, partial [Kofleriaceae bacterium]
TRAVRNRADLVLLFTTLGAACGGGSDSSPDATELDAGIPDAAPVRVGADVVIDSGPLHGMPDGDLVRFTGIPFATAGRWESPTAPAAWTSPRDATAFGPACPQPNHSGLPQDENCLLVNVWAHADGAPRPVIVWIHGGGYIEGTAREAQYDGASLARATDATIVSFDYRLGVLGYLALPQLAAPDGGIGNYGLRDQIAALQWVKRNIAIFGGDPSRVTITGESAGGAATCTLLAAPGAQGLFVAASIQSGPCGLALALTTPTGTIPGAQAYGAVAVATQLGCTSGDIAACLRSKTVAQILALNLPVYFDLGFGVSGLLPVVDGVTLDRRPLDALAAGRGAVPVIVGSNLDDASAFVIGMGVTSFASYLQFLQDQGALTAQQRTAVLALYPTASFGGEVGAATAFSTDRAFACVAQQVATARAAPTYLYELARKVPNGPLAPYGAVHGYDFINLFSSFAEWAITTSSDDLALADEMRTAWAGLAHGTAPWPAAPMVRTFDVPSSTQATWRGGRCAQLAALGLEQH